MVVATRGRALPAPRAEPPPSGRSMRRTARVSQVAWPGQQQLPGQPGGGQGAPHAKGWGASLPLGSASRVPRRLSLSHGRGTCQSLLASVASYGGEQMDDEGQSEPPGEPPRRRASHGPTAFGRRVCTVALSRSRALTVKRELLDTLRKTS